MTEEEVLELINGKKITELPELGTTSGDELFPVVKNNITYKTSVNAIVDNPRLVKSNDTRVTEYAPNGQTAYSWGNHATAGYVKTDTKYYPGDGMSLTGVTFNVKFGTDGTTAVRGNDARLSNAREWTADTILQAEAESGTATTRRAFTAQRVRQAIIGWYNTLSSYSRGLIAKTTAAQWRTELGLGSASTKNVGTSTGNVMEVGAFGVGTGIALGANANLNNYQTPGFYYQNVDANTSGALNYPVNRSGSLLVQVAAGVTQQYIVYNSSDVYVRGLYNGVWSAWNKLISTNDMQQTTGSNKALPMSQAAVTNMFSNNKSDIGWCELGGGMILQWGRMTTSNNWNTKVKFPREFPNKCVVVNLTGDYIANSSPTGDIYTTIGGVKLKQKDGFYGGGNGVGHTLSYIAIGY